MSGVSVWAKAKAEGAAAGKSVKSGDDDADLDAYLMGALGSDDEAAGIDHCAHTIYMVILVVLGNVVSYVDDASVRNAY